MVHLNSAQKRILKDRGVALELHTCKPIPFHLRRTQYHRTHLMKLKEMEFGEPIVRLLWKYPTIDAVADYLHIERSTVSKWRTQLESFR